MKVLKVEVQTIFHCTLEQAFKTPFLCDVSKVHTGYGFMPGITHCTEDEYWGIPGHSKKVFAKKSLFHKGGWVSMDKVLKRNEDVFWKIEVSQFQTWILGFTKFVGEWHTSRLKENEIQITYKYYLYADKLFLFPLQWVFAKVFWPKYMKQVVENIRNMIDQNEPYLYP